MRRALLIAAGVLVFVAALLYAAFGPTPAADPNRGADAARNEAARARALTQVACQDAIRAQLVSPGSMRKVDEVRAELAPGSETRWVYYVTVDSQNAFGALLRSSWGCAYDTALGRVDQLQQR